MGACLNHAANSTLETFQPERMRPRDFLPKELFLNFNPSASIKTSQRFPLILCAKLAAICQMIRTRPWTESLEGNFSLRIQYPWIRLLLKKDISIITYQELKKQEWWSRPNASSWLETSWRSVVSKIMISSMMSLTSLSLLMISEIAISKIIFGIQTQISSDPRR